MVVVVETSELKEEGTFAASLYDNYIKPALDVSCTPILCTPIVRRTATGEWTKQELHITDDAAQFKGGDYSQAVPHDLFS